MGEEKRKARALGKNEEFEQSRVFPSFIYWQSICVIARMFSWLEDEFLCESRSSQREKREKCDLRIRAGSGRVKLQADRCNVIKILSSRSMEFVKWRRGNTCDRKGRMRSDEENLRRILTRSRSSARVDQARKERKGVLTDAVETLRTEWLVERISFRSAKCAKRGKRDEVRIRRN